MASVGRVSAATYFKTNPIRTLREFKAALTVELLQKIYSLKIYDPNHTFVDATFRLKRNTGLPEIILKHLPSERLVMRHIKPGQNQETVFWNDLRVHILSKPAFRRIVLEK